MHSFMTCYLLHIFSRQKNLVALLIYVIMQKPASRENSWCCNHWRPESCKTDFCDKKIRNLIGIKPNSDDQNNQIYRLRFCNVSYLTVFHLDYDLIEGSMFDAFTNWDHFNKESHKAYRSYSTYCHLSSLRIWSSIFSMRSLSRFLFSFQLTHFWTSKFRERTLIYQKTEYYTEFKILPETQEVRRNRLSSSKPEWGKNWQQELHHLSLGQAQSDWNITK